MRFKLRSLLAGLLMLPSIAGAGDTVKASAEIKGCTNPAITGTATFKEQVTAEGLKAVTVQLNVKGLPEGKHAVHVHEVGEPCAAAGGARDACGGVRLVK